MSQKKLDSRSLALSYQKKVWPGTSPDKPFWYDTDYRIVLFCLHRLYFIVGATPKECLARLVPAKPFFSMKTPQIFRPVFGWSGSYEACHEKTDLKFFVVVIPKEDLAGTSPLKLSFGMTLTNYKLWGQLSTIL